MNPGDDVRIPFGFNKGKRLSEATDTELRSLRDWCSEHDAKRFASLIQSIEEVLEDRQGLPLGLDGRAP